MATGDSGLRLSGQKGLSLHAGCVNAEELTSSGDILHVGSEALDLRIVETWFSKSPKQVLTAGKARVTIHFRVLKGLITIPCARVPDQT